MFAFSHIRTSVFAILGIAAFVFSSNIRCCWAVPTCYQASFQTSTKQPAADDDKNDILKKLKLVRQLEKQRIKTINKVKPAVVAVFGLDKKGGGSGVIIHPSGLALTNHHVVQGAGARGVGGLDDGKQYPWELIGNDPGGDLALIKLHRKEPFPYVELGDSDKVKVGDWTLVMGNPFLLAEDFNPTVTFGIVSGVKRYQKGMTDRLLVYGNCIQVDTSINPGNSGGPLFDIEGRLIGINGRASFDFAKRGRVNVGIGYAISINQCRNFLPDLLATKLVQHGGLDAVFDDRDGKVVCSEIFEDAELSTLGMDIGDELVEFEGEKIRSANHFTNLLCTLPAGWPARITFKSKSGSLHKVTTRLVGLPYPKASPPPARKKPKIKKPVPKKDQKADPKNKKPNKENPKDAPQKKDTKKPQKKTQKKPVNKKLQAIQKSKVDFFKFMSAKGGKIQNAKRAKNNAQYVVDFSEPVFDADSSNAWQINTEILEAGRKVGTQSLTIKSNGDFELKITAGKNRELWTSKDGKFRTGRARADSFSSWDKLETKSARLSDMVKNPYALSAYCLVNNKRANRFPVSVDGSDSLDLTPCCRLSLETGAKQKAFVWYSLYDFIDKKKCRIEKTGIDVDGSDGLGAIRYHDWESTPFGSWPKTRTLVNGINELKIQTWKNTEIKKAADK